MKKINNILALGGYLSTRHCEVRSNPRLYRADRKISDLQVCVVSWGLLRASQRRIRYSRGLLLVFSLLVFCFSCTPKPKSPAVSVSLIDSGRSIKFSGLDLAVINEISRDSANWQSLIPVYRMPADTDLKSYQPAQPGIYSIKDSSVVFTPDTPFIKGNTYFMRYYQFAKDNDMQAFIRGRNRLNNIQHTDLIFKQ